GQGISRIYLPDYADGIHMGVGAGSVGVPGVLAAVYEAWRRHGRIEWAALFERAIGAARSGLPFPKTSAYYLSVTWNRIWYLHPGARRLFGSGTGADEGYRPLREGEPFVQAELAEALEQVAKEGPDVFYRDGLARKIESAVAAGSGFLGAVDLAEYRAQVRAPIAAQAWGWCVATNPPPAVGGVVLAHMLALMSGAPGDAVERLRSLVRSERTALDYRSERYRDPADVANAWAEAASGMGSPSTTHMSAADSDGYVCSITESIGYGSGLVVHGIPLNNSLGEEELNPLGVHRSPPGARIHSNMTPTIATGPDRTVGLGSPGASRIVGAITQTLMRLAIDGEPLADAVAGPRAHLDPTRPEGPTLSYEPGLPGDALDYVLRPYDDRHMYFGAVQAASVSVDGSVDAAHDPRRSGASALI
ncbi:MAG: gamma-glutamyltransferase family protein, partial [Actinomycetota bacterium]|nr:gamma-glutamyltransferase family protein [Actinomycetota bacterium]